MLIILIVVYCYILCLFPNAGLCLPAIFLLLCGFYGSDTLWAILFLSLSVGCVGFAVAGINVNHLDIAPRYAGILMGISNMAATIPGFAGPQVAKAIAKKVNCWLYIVIQW